MAEAAVAEFDKGLNADSTPVVRIVESYLLTAPKVEKPGSSNYNSYVFRLAMHKRVDSIERNEELDSDQKEEEVAKIAHDVFHKRGDAQAAAIAIALFTRHQSIRSIVPDEDKAPNEEQREKAYEAEQVMRNDIVRKAGLPEDFFESHGFLKPQE